jgi:hypothetical protein
MNNNNPEVHFALERDFFPTASFPIDLFCGSDSNNPSDEDDILVVEFLRYGGELKNIGDSFALVFKDKNELGHCISSVLAERKKKLTSGEIRVS